MTILGHDYDCVSSSVGGTTGRSHASGIEMIAARDAWLASVVGSAQRFSGTLADTDPQDARALADAFATSLEPAPDRLHNMVLGALLLDTALHISDCLHRLANAKAACACGTLTRTALRAFLGWRDRDARDAFREWTAEFFQAYQRHHPRTAANRVARLIRQRPEQPWTSATLAILANVPARGLARTFRREYKVGIRTYVHIARVRALLARPSRLDVNIDATALEAGYRSRKDFYRVLRQTLETTPSSLRRLLPDERIALQDGLSARLLQRMPRRRRQ